MLVVVTSSLQSMLLPGELALQLAAEGVRTDADRELAAAVQRRLQALGDHSRAKILSSHVEPEARSQLAQ